MNAEKQHSSKIKSTLKELLPAYIIDFVFCYMLFIYEPLMMYCTNKDDFWFDLGIMAAPMAGVFLIFFTGFAAVLTALYFVSRRFSGELKPYRLVTLYAVLIFIALYIQGNFLIKRLPALDGSAIDWSAYTREDVITLIILLALGAVWIFALIKLDLGKLVNYAAGLSLAVFVMLNVSLITTLAQSDPFEEKNNFISAAEGFNGASSDKNFFIFMVDSQSSPEFAQALSEKELEGAFEDFTFYTDTLSLYAYTRDSLPFVLSGHANKNEEDFGKYCAGALNDSELFKALDERGYDIRLYSSELAWYGRKNFNIKNDMGGSGVKLKFGEFFKQEMTYVWFKYLPYGLKSSTGIEYLDFNRCIDKFDWRNDVLYKEFQDKPELSKIPGAQFRFIHAEGAHVPFDMDENMNRIDNKNGTYLMKTTATAKLISAFIERLKANDVYDNSVIIIMADHGYQPAQNQPENYILSRFNPVLLIKGVGEKHEFEYSDKPVSYLDLPGAYLDLLDGKQSAELFPEAKRPRTRTVIWYEIYKEEHMAEYQTDGKAREWDKFRETGKVFDLPKN